MTSINMDICIPNCIANFLLHCPNRRHTWNYIYLLVENSIILPAQFSLYKENSCFSVCFNENHTVLQFILYELLNSNFFCDDRIILYIWWWNSNGFLKAVQSCIYFCIAANIPIFAQCQFDPSQNKDVFKWTFYLTEIK